MKIKNILLLLALFATVSGGLKAQDQEIGGFLGISVYNGDLAQSPIPIRGSRPSLGAFYRYNFNSKFAFRVGFNYGYIASYDHYSGKGTDREFRNLSFHSPLAELHGIFEYNFKSYVSGSRKYNWTPYVFAGLAGFYFNPKTFYNGTVYNLREYKTEQSKMDKVYSPLGIAIPLGIGIKYSLGQRKMWNFGFEVGFRKTFTDYLDDVSGNLPDNFETNPQLSADDRKLAYRGYGTAWPRKWPRGNPDRKDSYFFYGITLSKTIRNYDCRY